MSPKMSSLAFDDVQEESVGRQIATGYTPEFHVIQSRYSRNRSVSSPIAADMEDVVHIGGRFTISF